jgi:peroxiredoxin
MNRRRFLPTLAAGAGTLAVPGAFAQSAPALQHALSGTDHHGKPVDLQAYAGKICLVTFFSAGCAPCGADLKLIRDFHVANKARNFVMLGVNLDNSKDDYMNYMRIVELSLAPDQRFPIAWRNAPNHTDSFGTITRKPTHFVLDRTHKQVLKREGLFQPNDWDDLWLSLG